MLPGLLRTSIAVAAALATFLAGVQGAFAEVRWPGTSISSPECRAWDYGRDDDPGRPACESAGEDQDDEDDRELPISMASPSLCQLAPSVAFLACHEHRPHGSSRPAAPLVRGPPAAL